MTIRRAPGPDPQSPAVRSEAVPPATCSTPACRRTPRPGWAMCDVDALDLLAPLPRPRAVVARLSLTLLAPASRPAARPDLAGLPGGNAASRDRGAQLTEAPATRCLPSRPAGTRSGAARHFPRVAGRDLTAAAT